MGGPPSALQPALANPPPSRAIKQPVKTPGHSLRAARGAKAGRLHPHAWIWEQLEEDPTFVLRSMFGTKAVYLEGKLFFCFADRREPWSGMLVATERRHHASLVAEIPALRAHPVLPKWLYLSQEADCFEREAPRLVRLAAGGDGRLGVTPQRRARRQATK